MPTQTRAYRVDRITGMLIWEWEENFGGTTTNMDNKKKKYPKVCEFCKKDITNRPYTIEKEGIKYWTCSACKFLFGLLCEEVISGRFDSLREMVNRSLMCKRHCRVCKHFRPYRESECQIGRSTGVGSSATTNYPFSYANHGCAYFERKIFKK